MATDHEQILSRAINKAIENGWKRPSYLPSVSVENLAHDAVNGLPYVNTIIYNHEFAKALWGEKRERVWACPKCGYAIEWYKHNESQQYCPTDGRKLKDATMVDEYAEHPWHYHLQQMVISPDPIQYLAEHI